MFPKTGNYNVNPGITNDNGKCKRDRIWTISKEDTETKTYTYNEAVDLTGHGFYSIMMLAAGCFSLMGMSLDCFALPAVSSVAACELKMGTYEEKIIMSLPFLGAMLTAYPWGYLADTRGRRLALMLAMWGSFIASFLAAFSKHWLMLALLKCISISCSTSGQSTAYTLIGESCAARVKVAYLFIMTASLHMCPPIQMALHYYTLTLKFSVDLGIITFTPWRMLAIILALPLAASGILLCFLYESPKYLANAGKENEAVKTLANIWKRNGQGSRKYPVNKIITNEEGVIRNSDVPFLKSLWNQTIPMFRMPLLLRTLQLYFLIMVVYGAVSGLLGWYPFLADAFISGSLSSQNTKEEGLCVMISRYAALKAKGDSSISCVPKSSLTVIWASLGQGVALSTINCAIGLLEHRRKLLMIGSMLIPCLAALGCATLPSNVASLTAYFSIFLSILGIGIIMSYFVDLYPTSHRGMVSCLAILLTRFSAILSINVTGSLIMDHCYVNLILISAFLLCGVIASCFLPPDKQIKSQ